MSKSLLSDHVQRNHEWVLLLSACVAGIFNGILSIPVLEILWPGLVLALTCGSHWQRWSFKIVAWLLLSICYAVGNADMLAMGISRFVSYLICCAFGLVFVFFTLCACTVQVAAWSKPEQGRWHSAREEVRVLGMPLVWTAFWQIWGRLSPTGIMANPAMGLVVFVELRQLASVFGEISLIFFLGWSSSVVVGHLLGQCGRRQLMIWLSTLLIVLVLGGIRVGSGRGMWLDSIDSWPESQDTLQISCVLGGSWSRTGDDIDVVRTTNERLAAGDDVVIWSEEAGGCMEPEDLPSQLELSPGSLVAAAYADCEDKHNAISLVQEGQVLDTYWKNRPVPFVEAGLVPGKRRPKPVDVVGRRAAFKVATAICFDFDFPDVLRGAAGADLVLGPSQYWASMGQALWRDNTYRAVENGFTLFKCAGDGISGAVDPYGRSLATKPTTSGEVFTAEVALQPRVWTFYAHGGWIFGWLCVGLAPLVVLSLLQKPRQEPQSEASMQLHPPL